MNFRLLTLSLLILSACAYKWGNRDRAVPGGYKQVAIPIFKNLTQQVGMETDFTNALVREFERSQVAQVTDRRIAPVRIDGTITRLQVLPGAGGVTGVSQSANPLPVDSVLMTAYQLVVTMNIQVRRQSDEKILWEGAISDQTTYQAPRIGEPIVNSANATYNDSALKHSLTDLSAQMMSEAHDRITENF